MKRNALLVFILFTGLSLYAQPGCGFAGNWKTNWDGTECQLNMIMTYANTMTGTYYYETPNGTVTGTVYGTVKEAFAGGSATKVSMAGKWTESNAGGTFLFLRDCSVNSFAGSWENDNGREKGEWVGFK